MKLIGHLIAGLAVIGVTQLDPKPISVKHRFASEHARAELEGVCKVSAESVACWKPDGTPNRALREEMLAYVRRYSRINQRYGKKTRYAVFRVRQRFDSRAPLSFSTAWDLSDRTLPDADRLLAVPIVADFGETTGDVTAQIQITPERSVPLRIAVGEKLDYQGGSLRVDKVVRGQADAGDSDPNWLIYTTYTGPRMDRAWWTVFDHEEISVTAVDLEGRPAFVDPHILNQAESRWSAGSAIVRPSVRVARFHPSVATHGQFREGPNILVTNIDPAQIKYVTLSTSAVQAIHFTDIPLEPK